jgi:hypothetical protein
MLRLGRTYPVLRDPQLRAADHGELAVYRARFGGGTRLQIKADLQRGQCGKDCPRPSRFNHEPRSRASEHLVGLLIHPRFELATFLGFVLPTRHATILQSSGDLRKALLRFETALFSYQLIFRSRLRRPQAHCRLNSRSQPSSRRHRAEPLGFAAGQNDIRRSCAIARSAGNQWCLQPELQSGIRSSLFPHNHLQQVWPAHAGEHCSVNVIFLPESADRCSGRHCSCSIQALGRHRTLLAS